jgi:SAM-dependent methyltransferase
MVDRFFADPELAGFYDPLCPRDHRPDFDFYLPMVMQARAVLDVGCGTGALLKEARDLGHRGRLCGLDPASGMLALARRRSDIEWVLGDLGAVAWRSEFDLVVMTGHAFQVLLTDEAVRTSLGAIRSALTSDGRFAFETRNPPAREWESWTPDRVAIAEADEGASVTMVRAIETPFDGERLTFTHTFSRPGWSHSEVSRSTLRFFTARALGRLLAAAGLGIDAQFGSWERAPLSDSSPEIITIARRA